MSYLFINVNGNKKWHVNSVLHRTDGPAIENADGSKEWWVGGKKHRTDGPAIEFANGDQSWWVNDVMCMSNKEFQLAANLTDEELAEVILKHGNVE